MLVFSLLCFHVFLSSLCRKLVMEDAARVAEPSECLNRVVFDLDHLLAGSRSDPGCRRPLTTGFQLSPHEAGLRISQGFQKLRYSDAGHDGLRPLVFESRFECGNLRKATQVCRTDTGTLVLCRWCSVHGKSPT